jgi:exosortase
LEPFRVPARPNWWPATLAGIALWLLLVRQLSVEWSVNAQYAYGWSVPFLMLYLLGERWRTRPVPGGERRAAIPGLIAGFLLFLLFPVRLVQEANPEWRLVSWVLAFQVVGISLAAIWLAGGRPWLRHFAFPLLFFLTAVPWPVPLENEFVQHLMRLTATWTIEGLHWCGVEALQRGNLIQLSSQILGIDEACSGVRSLQATLMLSLFLGEFYRFGWMHRLALAGGGLLVAFLTNVGRAFILSMVAERNGPSSFHRWHDPAGFAILAVCLLSLWLLARSLAPGHGSVRETPPAPGAGALRLISGRVLAAVAAWMALAEIGTEAWYRAHERAAPPKLAWSVSWPVANPTFKKTPIPEATHAILRDNEGRSGSWTAPDGSRWQMFFLRWDPGRNAAQLARNHNPQVCLPALGNVLEADLGLREITVQGVPLIFHAYVFRSRGEPLHVFQCLWEARSVGENMDPRENGSPRSRMRAVAQGRRHLGQQMLELAVRGYSTPRAAQAALTSVLGAEAAIVLARN